MADEKAVDLVAVDRGFYRGKLIEPGKKFTFYGDKIPKWAAEPGKFVPKKPKALGADTRPKEAQLAVKAKAAGLTGDGPAD
jgi:hypothetical protein